MTRNYSHSAVAPTPKGLAAYYNKEADAVLQALQAWKPDDWQQSPTMHYVRLLRDTAAFMEELDRRRTEDPTP